MSKKKKQLQQYQINDLLRKKKIILLYQHSNLKAQDWILMKEELSKISPRGLAPDCIPLLETSSDGRGVASKKMMVPTPHLSKRDAHGQASFVPSKPLPIKGGRGVLTLVLKNRIGCLSSLFSEKVKKDVPISSLSTDGSIVDLLRPPFCTSLASRNDVRGDVKGKSCLKVSLQGSTLLSDAVAPPSTSNYRKDTILLQGSIFLLACDFHEEMVLAYQIISRYRDKHYTGIFLLVGGFYFGKAVTHLDVAKLSTLTPLAFGAIPLALEERLASLINEELVYCQRELLHCLEAYKSSMCATDPTITS